MKGAFQQTTPRTKPTEKEAELNLSIVRDEDFDCYNKSDDKPVHTKTEDEIQFLLRDDEFRPQQGKTNGNNKPIECYNQSENTKGYLLLNKWKNWVAYRFIPIIKKVTNGDVLQEKTSTKLESNKEKEH